MNAAPIACVVDALERSGCEPKKRGRGWSALCPAHEDRSPSLNIDEGGDGRALIICRAGCTPEAIVDRLGLKLSDLFEARASVGRPLVRAGWIPSCARKKDYIRPETLDEDIARWMESLSADEELYAFLTTKRGLSDAEILRAKLGHDGERYTIPVFDREGHAYYIVRYLPGAERKYLLPRGSHAMLYGEELIQNLLDRVLVIVTEGLLDALLLRQYGYTTVSGTTGADTWRDDWSEALARFDVVVAFDNDPAGAKGSDKAVASIRRHGGRVRALVWPPNTPAQTDPTDFLLRQDHVIDEFQALLDSAREPIPRDEREESTPTIDPCDFAGIADPNVGKVAWVVEGLLARDELTLIAATWKTAKTLIAYSLIVDVLIGRPVWGRFSVERPLRVLVIQCEMPHREDLRRFRRLCIGAGRDPTVLQECARLRQLVFFSRPPLDLTNAEDIAVLQDMIKLYTPDLLVVDSAVAAFASEDLNDNPAVRRCLSRAFLPVTSAGVSVLLLHHYRKQQQGPFDNVKAKVLGAGQFGAAASRVYGLERLEPEQRGTRFRVCLSSLGAWAPGEEEDVILQIEDSENQTGTTVQVVDGPKARSRKVLAFHNAALHIKDQVEQRGRVSRKTAIARCASGLRVSPRTAASGLAHAEGMGWVQAVSAEGAKHGEVDLLPGSCGTTAGDTDQKRTAKGDEGQE